MPPTVSLARVVERTDAEGPGTRFAVWVQGCSIRCPGCFNPQLWTTRGGAATDPFELAGRVPDDVDGVTLLGGEPFEQPAALAVFAREVRRRGLSVMAFSGYTLDTLQTRAETDAGTAALLAETDLLIDGPYLRDEPDHERPWVGSRNQGFRTLTERYAHLADRWTTLPDRIEVHVASDGTTSVNGWADTAALEDLLDGMRRVPPGRR